MQPQSGQRHLLFSFGGIFVSLLLSFVFLSRGAYAATTLSVCENTSDCAFTTIQSAVDAIPAKLSSAYVIEIRDSRTYKESVTIGGKETNAEKTITLRSAAGASPILSASPWHTALTFYYENYVTVDSIHFSGDLRARAGAVEIIGGKYNIIRNSRFSYLSEVSGVVVYGGGSNRLESNVFDHGLRARGVTIYSDDGNNIVQNNTFITMPVGVYLGGRVGAETITQNIFLLEGTSETAIVSEVPLDRAQRSRVNQNQYYLARGAKLGTIQGTNYPTLSEWQVATGFDIDARIITAPSHPLFISWSEVTKTVCATGCDYATIGAAVDGIPSDVAGISHELISRNISYRIEVRDAGPYDGGIRIGIITDPDRTLTITAAPGIRPIIRESSYQRGIEIYYSDYVTLRGFWFPGGHKTNFFGGPIGIEGGNNNTIEDNLIKNTPNAPAIVIHGGAENRVLNNQIRNVSRGLFIYASSGGHTIRGNTIADTFSAVAFKDRTANIRIENNTFFKNKRGIDIGPEWGPCTDDAGKIISCNYTIRNTIIVSDGDAGAAFFFAKSDMLASLDSDYNLFYSLGGASIAVVAGVPSATLSSWYGQGKDQHSIFGDPLFADTIASPYDFHVQSQGGRLFNGSFVIDLSHSPAIDAGDPLTIFANESSPNGGRVNIGAYGNTVEASRSFINAPPPPPPSPSSTVKNAAWTDTSDIDWEAAQKLSATVTGSGSAASITLGGQSEAWESASLGIRETIADVAFTSTGDGFAVGSGGTILRWDGTTWNTLSSGTTENLWSVAFTSTTAAFAVGTNGTILRWNGTTWSAVVSGTTEHLLSVSSVAANDAIAVGTNGTILRWNGTTWSAVVSGTTKTLNAVFMSSATNGWIVGNSGTILRWNGTTWSTVASPTTQVLLGVEERPDGSVLVIGDAGFIARYANNVWTTPAALTNGALLSITFLSSGRGWIVGETGIVLETQNGVTWTVAASAPESTEAFFATAVAGTTQWVMGTNGTAFRIVRLSNTDGSLLSRVFDAGVAPQWKTLAWSGHAVAGATARVQFATSASASGPWNFVGPDGTTASFYTGAETPTPAIHNGQRFSRYQILLQRSMDVAAPVVDDITMRYAYDGGALPLAPTALSPRNTMLVAGGSLTWSSVPGGITYAIEIAREITFSTPVFSASGLTALSLAMPALADGIYVWRVRVSTANGDSAWSDTQAFTLDRTPPASPSIVMPLDQSTIGATPELRWTAVDSVQQYQLQLGTNADLSSPLLDIQGLQTINFFPSFPFANGSYTWRVRTFDRAGNASAWAVGRFVLAAVEQPPVIAPPLLNPRDQFTTSERSLTFRWEQVAGARAYVLMVSGGPTFVDTIFPPVTISTTEFTWTVSVPDGPYYWRVRAVNNGGSGSWSSEQSFTLDTTSPRATTILGLSPGALLTTPATPKFNWEPISDVVSYTLEVDNRRQETITETSFTFAEPFDLGMHLWRVQGVDSAGNIGDWVSSSFAVVSPGHSPPEAPPGEEDVKKSPEIKEEKPVEKPLKKSIEIPPEKIIEKPQESPEEKLTPPKEPQHIKEIPEEKPSQTPSPVPSVHESIPEENQGVALPPILTTPRITNINPPLFEGRTSSPQTVVTVSVNDQVIGSTVSDTDNRFVFSSPIRLAEGSNIVKLENMGSTSSVTLIVDTVPPPTPVIAETRIVSQEPDAEGENVLVRIGMRLGTSGDTVRFILQDENGRTVIQFPATQTAWQMATLRETPGEKRYVLLGIDAAGNRSGASSIALSISRTLFAATCSDGLDNDTNGQIDYPSDRACATPFASEGSSLLDRGLQQAIFIVEDATQTAKRVTEKTVNATVVVAERTERALHAAAPIAVPTLTVAAPLAIAMNPVTASSLPALPGMATNAFSWLFSALGIRKKRKNPWGMVYDAITKEPIGLAILRLFDAGTKQLLATQVTDKDGRFEFLVKQGTYTLTAQKTPFIFPSAIVIGKGDEGLLDVYHGEVITIATEGQTMHVNIPLDPENTTLPRIASLHNTFERIRQMASKASLPLLVLGTGISIIMYAFTQTRYNLLVLLVYVGFAAYQTILAPKKLTSWGTIFDATTLEPVPLAMVSIIDPQYQRVLKTRLSDYQGRFTFLPDSGTYQLKVTKAAYQFPSKADVASKKYHHLYRGESLSVEKKKAIIAVDVPLDPEPIVIPPSPSLPPSPYAH